MPEASSLEGEVAAGRYELTELLGAGGMGEVWRARDERLGRDVAVKVFAPPRDPGSPGSPGGPGTADRSGDSAERAADHDTEHAELLARFDREARAVAALDSPGIVTVHDHGAADIGGTPGTPYLVMALLRGRTLEQAVRDEGRIPWRRALDWAEQVCRALAAAHAAGVVHRDIKPANVIVTDDGSEHGAVTVLDFGIAHVTGDAAGQRLTRTGAMPFGSVLYLAPERFRDEAGDARTDLYSLGCVLYELLVGRPPYTGSSAQVMFNHLHDTPLRPSRARRELPAAVDALVLFLMATDPADRPQDAEAAAEAVREARDGHNAPPPADTPEPQEDPQPQHPEPQPEDAAPVRPGPAPVRPHPSYVPRPASSSAEPRPGPWIAAAVALVAAVAGIIYAVDNARAYSAAEVRSAVDEVADDLDTRYVGEYEYYDLDDAVQRRLDEATEEGELVAEDAGEDVYEVRNRKGDHPVCLTVRIDQVRTEDVETEGLWDYTSYTSVAGRPC